MAALFLHTYEQALADATGNGVPLIGSAQVLTDEALT